MRADRRRLVAGGAAAMGLLVPTLLGAQVVVGDSVTAFVPSSALAPAIYDGEGRRDPFDPLTLENSPATGPRFEALRLTGVFLGAPGNSLVVLEDPTRRGHFLRVGERIGEARLVQIQPQSAVFEVEEYGTVRREVLRLERSEEKP
ncbi:MAG TPA: hypothetical protein VFH82_00835 [Gemmatimonadota bacterium]|nr:hypothetical protein [Gemmatimonadota bacterium]